MTSRVFPIAPAPPARQRAFYALLGLLVVVPVALGVAWSLWPSNVRFETRGGGLTIRGSVYGRALAPAEVKGAEARRVSFSAEPALRPGSRTNGIGLPTYQGGWFRLHDGRAALLFLSDPARAVIVPTTTDPVLLSPADPDQFLAALKDAGRSTVVGMPLAPAPPGSLLAGYWWAFPLGLMVPVSLGLLWLARRGGQVAFELTSDALRIQGSYYGQTIPRTAIELSGASIVAIRGHERFGRMLRVNGVGLPNYLAGWFRPRGGGRALLFVTDPGRVVALPIESGYTLIISPADPEGFLAALRQG